MNDKILPPKAMTTAVLKEYLRFAADLAPVENNPVIVSNEALGKVKLIDWYTLLFYETKRTIPTMTASDLMAYLETHTSSEEWAEHDNPVRHAKKDIVNAFVMDDHVILQTWEDMLEMENHRVNLKDL